MEGLFLVAEGCAGIEFESDEAVIDLYQSTSAVQVSPAGYPAQNGTAFIAAVRRGGNKEIHLAVVLRDSGETLCYVPEQQPASAADYLITMQNAINFLEMVGFTMDHVRLPAQFRSKILDGIPVLHRSG